MLFFSSSYLLCTVDITFTDNNLDIYVGLSHALSMANPHKYKLDTNSK